MNSGNEYNEKESYFYNRIFLIDFYCFTPLIFCTRDNICHEIINTKALFLFERVLYFFIVVTNESYLNLFKQQVLIWVD